MAKKSKGDGILKSLLAAMLAIFVVLSPASSAMSMQCNTQHVTTHHDASAISGQHPIKHEHGAQIGQDGCCKSNCVACAAVLAPYQFDLPIGRHDSAKLSPSHLLVGVSLPPLHGPPRHITSTL